ncbi:haloalkane dehalogenase [gamma proteobacterium BDW918]|uniref:Haloalkane dehalogenase n=1 Tax=Zhongshania aliphaticivorans TaxID=1470434 RepID=A0A127M5Y1_9GAMM|nr:haloalkane dehalogenase [Zhongshania aliphaticivorans]AMO68673.1 haloalkane dehalogenase [Zhongshania aliphaticivorans]EIF43397.1 haloalkane dehalogenase [gamma proteobacterium BDW918]
MKSLRTPDNCFSHLADYDFTPNYIHVDDTEGGSLRLHYVDEGPKDAPPILLMHGEPTWSYLYRKMIPGLAAAGFRVIAPDLIGFGRSDKPSERSDYTYQRHVDWLRALLDELDLQDITLFCQDWGGLIGLRLLAEENNRFSRCVAANTMLPTGDHHPGDAFVQWQQLSQNIPIFATGKIIAGACVKPVTADTIAAYDAPFPDESYKAGARQFPMLVPISADDPAAIPNRRAWEILSKMQKPFLTAFSDKDPITKGGDAIFQKRIPGCRGQAHTTITDGGHFLQEDQSERLVQVILEFITATPQN